MIGTIAAWLVGRGLAKTIPGSERLAKILVGVGLVIALALAATIAVKVHDRRIVAQAEAKRQAAETAKALEAERRANAAALARSRANQAAAAAIEKGMNDAKASDPVGAAKPVGPVQRGYFDGLPARKAD